MARVALLDRDEHIKPGAACFMTPHARDVRHACGFEFAPDQSRTDKAAHVIKLARRTRRRCSKKDGIVAVVESFHFDDGFRANVAGVITRPFTKRSFVLILTRHRFTFDNDFGVGWNWKSG